MRKLGLISAAGLLLAATSFGALAQTSGVGTGNQPTPSGAYGTQGMGSSTSGMGNSNANSESASTGSNVNGTQAITGKHPDYGTTPSQTGR